MQNITLKNQVIMLTKATAPRTLPILGMVRISDEQRLEATSLTSAVIIDGIGGLINGYIDAKTLKRGGLDAALANWDTVKSTDFSSDEWPEIPTPDDATIELNQATVSAIVEALVATSGDDTRPVLQTVQAHEGAISATDGYRLFSKGTGHKLNVLIPKEAAELIKLSKTLDGWYFGESADQITLKNDNLTIISRKIQGNYPDWRQLVPKSQEYEVRIEAKQLFDAIKLLPTPSFIRFSDTGEITAEAGDKKIQIATVELKREIMINPNNVHIVMPLKNYRPGSNSVTMNPGYLKDAIGKYKFLRISFSGGLSPTDVHGAAL